MNPAGLLRGYPGLGCSLQVKARFTRGFACLDTGILVYILYYTIKGKRKVEGYSRSLA